MLSFVWKSSNYYMFVKKHEKWISILVRNGSLIIAHLRWFILGVLLTSVNLVDFDFGAISCLTLRIILPTNLLTVPHIAFIPFSMVLSIFYSKRFSLNFKAFNYNSFTSKLFYWSFLHGVLSVSYGENRWWKWETDDSLFLKSENLQLLNL